MPKFKSPAQQKAIFASQKNKQPGILKPKGKITLNPFAPTDSVKTKVLAGK
jgi:hypothetical protein